MGASEGIKVLLDNGTLDAKLGRDYRDEVARGEKHLSADDEAGERKMMRDFGLTASELKAGLAGKGLAEWMESNARESGMLHPRSNPQFQQELASMMHANAADHNVATVAYSLMVDSMIRTSVGRLYGSRMSGSAYLRRNETPDKMDWSQIDIAPFEGKDTSSIMFVGKVLPKNMGDPNLFDARVAAEMEQDAIGYSWEDFEAESEHVRTVGEVREQLAKMNEGLADGISFD